MPKIIPYAVALIGLAFLLLGCGLLFNQVIRGRKQTEAEILSSSVEAYQHEDEGVVVTLYRSKYQIRYAVDGRTYNLPLTSKVGISSRTAVEKKLQNNPIGGRRPIYFLPSDPENFVADPLARRLGFCMIFITVGAGVLACGILLLYQAQPLDW